MASANTNKTVLALGFVAVLGFLAYKLWPAIRRAINSATGGGGGGPASIGGSLGSGSASPQQNPSNPLSLGAAGSSAATQAAANQNAAFAKAGQALQNLISGTSYQNSTPGEQDLLQGLVDQTPSDYPTSIPVQEYQLFPVNETATDMPGTDVADYSNSSDYSAYDPSAYAEEVSSPDVYIDSGTGTYDNGFYDGNYADSGYDDGSGDNSYS